MAAPAFMTQAWADGVAEKVNAFPDPEYRATKLDDYWDWIDAVKPGVQGALALSVRDLPDGLGADGDTLLLNLSDGVVTSAEVVGRAVAQERATYVMVGDFVYWQEMLDGYDVGKTVMYRRFLLEKGQVLAFFMSAYYWIEVLVALVKAPVSVPATASV